MKIEVSNGEIIDKLTILKIKLERIKDPEKGKNIQKEYKELSKASSKIMKEDHPLFKELYKINLDIWDIEELIHELERKKQFKQEYANISREVHLKNDKRSEIKKEINKVTSSKFIEEKSYNQK